MSNASLMFETITKAISALGFASLPTLEVKRATFGWRNIERTRLVLLVWMNFTNNGGKPFLINGVELDFVGEQLKPVESISEHFNCLTERGWVTESLRQVDNVVACPQIPAGNAVVTLFALFDLPVLTALNQNGVFGFTIRATFAPRRWRQVNFVIRNKL